MLLLDSLYIDSGGGKTLLNYLVKALEQKKANVHYLVDERNRHAFNQISSTRKTILKTSLVKRHAYYRQNKNTFDTILCFSSIPPTVKMNASIYMFFQNLLLIEPLPVLKLKVRFLLVLKRFLIKHTISNADFFILQTEHVKRAFKAYFSVEENKCFVIPFFEEDALHRFSEKNAKHYLFVSEGMLHKNHKTLLEAWEKVNKVDPSLQLHLTVSEACGDVLKMIDARNAKGVNIINHGFVNKEQLSVLYSDCAFLIYPSLIESFGLGLIEGIGYGCELLAPNLEYARGIVKPLAFFEPLNSSSIAEAVLQNRSLISSKLSSQLLIEDQVETLLDMLDSNLVKAEHQLICAE